MNYENITENVVEIARETGKFLLGEINKVKTSDIEAKGLHDFVSYVDKTSEAQIISKLQKLLPEAGFIAEEQTITTRSNKYNWIIDPLDGTTNYLHHIPLFSVSIALMEGDKIVSGVVFEPNRDECFYATLGHGSFLNNKRIQVSPQDDLRKTLLVTGFPYNDFSRMTEYMQLFDWFAQNTAGLRRLGSAAVDLAYTACGRFEGFYEYSLHAWDVAAGCLLVTEAGGKVTDFSGKDNYIFGGELLASNSQLHHILLHEVKTRFAK